MQRILITAIGSFSADIVIKKLHQKGYYVIGTDMYPKEWLVDAGNVDEFYNIPSAHTSKEYIRCLLHLCEEAKVDFIFPLTDLEIDILNENRSKFEKISVCICMSDVKTICICRDKRKTAAILNDVKICEVILEYSEKQILKKEISFPIICKPVNGRSSSGIRTFMCGEEFYDFYRSNNFRNYLIQPYIKGNVITVDIVRDKVNNRCIAIARKELLRTSNGAGLSVKIFRDDGLEKMCRKLAEVLDVTGCVNFEFIEAEDGNRYFLECNPRFSGGVEFSVMAGYDCITNHLKCFQNEVIEKKSIIKECWIARKYEEYITN